MPKVRTDEPIARGEMPIREARPSISIAHRFHPDTRALTDYLVELCRNVARGLSTASALSKRPRRIDTLHLAEAKTLTQPHFDRLQPSLDVIGNLRTTGRLLLVGAHPDDLTLSMSSLAFAGFTQVFAHMCTRGTRSNPRRGSAIAEAIASRADALFLDDAPDETGPEPTQQVVAEYHEILEYVSPSVVVTHLPSDPHPCHSRVSEVVARARLRMPLYRRPALLYARPPANFDDAAFRHDVHVVLGDSLAYWLASAIRLHPTEWQKNYYRAEHRFNSLAAQAAFFDRHGQANLPWAEAFMLAV